MLTHSDCGERVTAQVRCADGHDVGVDEIVMGPPETDDRPGGQGAADRGAAD